MRPGQLLPRTGDLGPYAPGRWARLGVRRISMGSAKLMMRVMLREGRPMNVLGGSPEMQNPA